MYSYIMECPACGLLFEEYREVAYKTVRRSKRCFSCKAGTGKKLANENQGETREKRCETCIHFGTATSPVKTNQWWKGCEQGYYSANDYGNLVYFLDWCSDYEGK